MIDFDGKRVKYLKQYGSRKNGWLGTVRRISPTRIRVNFDNGEVQDYREDALLHFSYKHTPYIHILEDIEMKNITCILIDDTGNMTSLDIKEDNIETHVINLVKETRKSYTIYKPTVVIGEIEPIVEVKPYVEIISE